MDIKIAFNKFVDYQLNERGKNPLTVRNYKSYVERLIRTSQVQAVGDIAPDVIRDFKAQLQKDGLSKKTVNLYLIGIRGFLSYLRKSNVEALDPASIELFEKIPDKVLDLVSAQELKKFLSHRLNPFSDLLVNILFATGLRISELNSLDIEGLNKCSFTVVGKGGKQRIVFLSEKVCKMLQQFVAGSGRKAGPIFANRWGKRVSVVYLQDVVRTRCDKLSVSKKITPHTLRHLFATNMLTNGADLRSIQELLGHSSILTTQKYTHVTNSQLEERHGKFSELR